MGDLGAEFTFSLIFLEEQVAAAAENDNFDILEPPQDGEETRQILVFSKTRE